MLESGAVLWPLEVGWSPSSTVKLRRPLIRIEGSSRKSWSTVGIFQNRRFLSDLSEILKLCVEIGNDSLDSLPGEGDVQQSLEGHPRVSRMLANLEMNLDV